MHKFILIILSIIFVNAVCVAQSVNRPLTNEEKAYLITQAKAHLKDFFTDFEQIGSSNQGLNKKDIDIISDFALSMFISNATVQIMNLQPPKNTYDIDEYLKNIVPNYPRRYKDVILKIESSNIDSINLKPVYDSRGNIIEYKSKVTFVQGFCATNKNTNPETFNPSSPDSFEVCEETTKTIDIIIKKKSSRFTGNRWAVYLGNIQANHIKNLKSSSN